MLLYKFIKNYELTITRNVFMKFIRIHNNRKFVKTLSNDIVHLFFNKTRKTVIQLFKGFLCFKKKFFY